MSQKKQTSFLWSNDKKLNLLHIATHGAYRVQKGSNVELHPCAFVRCHLKRLRNMRKIGSGDIARDMKE